MRKLLVRTGAFLLSAVIGFGAVTAGAMFSTSASETPTKVEYVFTGDEAAIAGFAQGTITITPGVGQGFEGYYLIYYTDGTKDLTDYDELGSVKATGDAVTFAVGDGWMLPVGAKGIAVFESSTRFVDEAPSMDKAVAVAEIPAAKQTGDFGTLHSSFGVLSDTHMNYEQHDRGAYKKLEDALNFYAKESMEYVVITGDATGDRGENPDLEAQYEKHLQILADSDFPADKVYEGIGNHGNTPSDAKLLDAYLGGEDEVHPYENSPYFYLLKEGDEGERDTLWIFASPEIKAPGDSAKYDNFSKTQMDWIEDLLTTYGNTETNIFMCIHAPFLNYGAGDRKNGDYTACITFKEEYTQTMRLKALLETYKDVIVMSGHTHVTFYDGVNYSNENDAFARTVHTGSGSQPCGYGESNSMTRSYDGRYSVTPTYGSEGYTVEVYKDFIVYTGYNLTTGKKIPAACLMLPVKSDKVVHNPAKIDTPQESAPTESAGQQVSQDEVASDAKSFPVGWVAGIAAVIVAAVAGLFLFRKKKNA